MDNHPDSTAENCIEQDSLSDCTAAGGEETANAAAPVPEPVTAQIQDEAAANEAAPAKPAPEAESAPEPVTEPVTEPGTEPTPGSAPDAAEESEEEADTESRPAATNRGLIALVASLALVILVSVWYAQPENRLLVSRSIDNSLFMAYFQARDRSEIALYCQQIGSAASIIGRTLDEIGVLAASYDPDTSGEEWKQSMKDNMTAIRIETGRARLLSPPLACANAHWTCMAGLDKIDQAMGELEKGLEDMDPLLIKNSYISIGEGNRFMNCALEELAGINRPAESGLEGQEVF